ncbi:MAG TPA: hypothetical protein VME44_15340, partial [Streptosporangiaceae bacterium]|nr:hypothetical protein [Streptosporangiaceae bacterium]
AGSLKPAATTPATLNIGNRGPYDITVVSANRFRGASRATPPPRARRPNRRCFTRAASARR